MSELPEGWVTTQLGELLKRIVGGGTPSKASPAYFQGAIPFMTVKDLHARFVADTQDHISDTALEDSASTLVPADTLIIATRMSLGKITRPLVTTAINQDLKALFLHEGVDKTYVEYLWRANEARIQGMGTGTTVKGIRLEDIRGLDVPLAPSAEQTRIANQLDTLLTRIQSCNDRFDAIPALLKRFRQAVLGAATSGALTQEWQGAGKATWKSVKLSEVAGSFSYGSAAKSAKTGAVPVLRMGNIQGGCLDWSDLVYTSDPKEIEKYKLTKGDVLFNRTNSPELVGKTAVYQGEQPAIYAGYLIRVRCSAALLPEYLNYCLGSKYGRDYCWSVKSDGVSQSNINAKKLAAFPFALPAVEEQTEIVRRVEALFALADRIEARASAARAHAQRLTPLTLAKAFRGELSAQDPRDEPASLLLTRIAAAKPMTVAASRGNSRAKPKDDLFHPLVSPTDWTALPDGVWAAPDDVDGHAVAALLVAVLRVWGKSMPQASARLATVLCQQPQLMAAALPADQALQWRRLVGHAAEPLPIQVTRLQPATSSQWRKAITRLRTRGDLVEAGTGPKATWMLGAGAAQIETAGWPEGRAGWVVAYLHAHGVEAILPSLEPLTVEFLHAIAA